MECVRVDHVLIQWLVSDCGFCHLEFEPLLSTWHLMAIGALGSSTIVLCVE